MELVPLASKMSKTSLKQLLKNRQNKDLHVWIQTIQPENSLDNVVFFKFSTYFTVYRGGPMGFFTEKNILFQGSRGDPTFYRGWGVGAQLVPVGGGSKC